MYQDIILGDDLPRVIASLQHRSLYVIVLCPSVEVIATRAEARSKPGYGAFAVADLDKVLRQRTPKLGPWLDSSGLSVAETAESVLERLNEAAVRTVA